MRRSYSHGQPALLVHIALMSAKILQFGPGRRYKFCFTFAAVQTHVFRNLAVVQALLTCPGCVSSHCRSPRSAARRSRLGRRWWCSAGCARAAPGTGTASAWQPGRSAAARAGAEGGWPGKQAGLCFTRAARAFAPYTKPLRAIKGEAWAPAQCVPSWDARAVQIYLCDLSMTPAPSCSRHAPCANTPNILDLSTGKSDYWMRRCSTELGLSHLSLTRKQTYVALITTLALREPVAHGDRYGLCSLSWTSTKLFWCLK